MPKNPSKRQQEASRKNLRGKYGPKTEEGKRKVALNGLQNKGAVTAKARARQIAGRHGPKTETFYSFAGCLECKKLCLWPSFSLETPLDKMPLECLKEVLEERPGRCFYYFEGFCCGTYIADQGSSSGTVPCILDDGFAARSMERLGKRDGLADRVELGERKRVWALKKEMEGYLETLRRHGPNNVVWTPRMVYVVREMSKMLRTCRVCKLESWRSLADLEEIVEQLCMGDLPPARTSR
jgi:hypothetical protein